MSGYRGCPLSPSLKSLRIASSARTIDEFIAAYQGFCDTTSIVVITTRGEPVGTDALFTFELADRTPALRGACTVLESWSGEDNRWHRPGMRLRIHAVTPATSDVLTQLRARAAVHSISHVLDRSEISTSPMVKLVAPTEPLPALPSIRISTR